MDADSLNIKTSSGGDVALLLGGTTPESHAPVNGLRSRHWGTLDKWVNWLCGATENVIISINGHLVIN